MDGDLSSDTFFSKLLNSIFKIIEMTKFSYHLIVEFLHETIIVYMQSIFISFSNNGVKLPLLFRC